MIISFLNSKGGVGKTTMTLNVAKAVEGFGKKVIVVDSDSQGSACDWHEKGNGECLDVVSIPRGTLDKDILKYKGQYDYIFVDGKADLDHAVTTKAIMCSDVILIPIGASAADIWAVENMVQLIKQRQTIMNGFPFASFVLSKQKHGTTIGKEVRDVLRELEMPVFKWGTYDRVEYVECFARGITVLQGRNDLAKHEVKMIAEELRENINVNLKQQAPI